MESRKTKDDYDHPRFGDSGDFNDLPDDMLLHLHQHMSEPDRTEFMHTCRRIHYFFSYKDRSSSLPILLEHIANGREYEADLILQRDPYLLLLKRMNFKAKVTEAKDYTHRQYADDTALEIALRAGDNDMCDMLKSHFDKLPNNLGQEKIQDYIGNVIPDGREGCAAHQNIQIQQAIAFEEMYLLPLVEAITKASIEDLQSALEKENNGSKLSNEIQRYRKAVSSRSRDETIFNPYHLLKAYQMLRGKFDQWIINEDDVIPHLRSDLFWRQVIGWEQRHLPINYVQDFCSGIEFLFNSASSPIDMPLKRITYLSNANLFSDLFDYDNGRRAPFFIDDSSTLPSIGYDFAIGKSGGPVEFCNIDDISDSLLYYEKRLSRTNNIVNKLIRNEIVYHSKPGN